jgi:DNA-binding transcriptional ArsR family regulator
MSSSSYTYDTDLSAAECEHVCIRPEDVSPLLGRVIDGATAARGADFFSLLADPTRLRMLHALAQSTELCVQDLATLAGSSQSAVSHQLRTLRAAGVVTRHRHGRVMAYRLADEHIGSILASGVEHVLESA